MPLADLRRAVIEAVRAEREAPGSVRWMHALADLAIAGRSTGGLTIEEVRDEVERAAWVAGVGRRWSR